MADLTPIKTVKNAVLFHDKNGVPHIRIDRVRLSYPFVGTPAEDKNDDGKIQKKWRVVGMLPKSSHGEAKNLIKEQIEALIKEVNKKDPKAKVPSSHWFLTNGNDKEDENMAGHFLVSASENKYRPKARDNKGQLIDDIQKIDEMFYGGCYADLLIRLWYFGGTSKSNPSKPLAKRIVAGFVGVKFRGDGEPFGAGKVEDDDAWDTSEDDENEAEEDDDGSI